MLTKRLLISIMTGALLGIVCIVGAQVRSGFSQEPVYLFAFWYNRVLMGTFIGFLTVLPSLSKTLMRGAFIGLIVSFAFYASTGFTDVIGFGAGIVYGVIIEYVALKTVNH